MGSQRLPGFVNKPELQPCTQDLALAKVHVYESTKVSISILATCQNFSSSQYSYFLLNVISVKQKSYKKPTDTKLSFTPARTDNACIALT